MKSQFISYKQAIELKELGFDEDCFGWYHQYKLTMGNPRVTRLFINKEDCKAPTFSQAFRFFRKNYDLFCGILTECSYGGELHAYHITGVNQGDISKGDFYSYETAESACLDKLIEIIKAKLPC